MSVRWRKKKARDNDWDADYLDIVCANLNGIHLEVFRTDREQGGLRVIWIVCQAKARAEFHAGGNVRCKQGQLKATFEKAKKMAERFACCWAEE